MQTSESINEIAAALAKAQGEISNPTKGKVNPHFKSNYADLATGLDTIRPTLAKHGLSVVQMTHAEGDLVTLHTRLMHSSGQWIESTYPVCRLTKHQEMGSALTYARRYALFAIVGIAGEDDDDDGNSAATARRRFAEVAPAQRVSSASIKRDKPDLWPTLERRVREAATIDALTELWDDTQEEAERWPQSWQDSRWELFESRTEELKATAQAAE